MAKTRDLLVKEVADLEATVKQLREQIATDMQERIDLVGNMNAAHTKALTDLKSQKDTWYNKANEQEREIEMVHLVLDTLPSAPPREMKPADAYSATRLTMLARFAGYLAIRP